MTDLQTALNIIASEIKQASNGYQIINHGNRLQISRRSQVVETWEIDRILSEMNGLYTSYYAAGSTFVKPVIA